MQDDMNDAQSQQLVRDVGEIKGALTMLLTVVQQNNESLNRRIDDLGKSVKSQTAAINIRLEDHQESVNVRFEALEQRIDNSKTKSLKTSGVTGATAGSIAVACIEVLKALISTGG